MASSLRGCCRLAAALVMIPLALVVALLLEAPVVTEVPVPDGGWPRVAAVGSAKAATVEQPAAEIKGAGDSAVKMGSGSMFDRIASVYDLANKWMSLGLDQSWRRALVQDCMDLQAGDRVLDLATGTADVSILIGSHLKRLGGDGAVLGLDPSVEMLRRGVDKVDTEQLGSLVRLVKGDAQNMSEVRTVRVGGDLSAPDGGVEDGSIDKISMSFGIRNVPDRALAFREMLRVLRGKPSNRVCILEFALPDGSTTLSRVAQYFITHVIPVIGKVATLGGADEYEYFQRSIVRFPKPLDFAASMAAEGLPVKTITSFAFGAVHLYAAAPS